MSLAIRFYTYLDIYEAHRKYECDECPQSLQDARNCDGSKSDPICPTCKKKLDEESETYEEKGIRKCVYCEKRVKYHYTLLLGKEFEVHQCPITLLVKEAQYILEIVNACNDMHTLPEPDRSIYDQSAFFMECRKIVVSEQRKAYEEIKPKDPPKPSPGSVGRRR